MSSIKKRLLDMYGENRRLPGIPVETPFARCENGIFIGRRVNGISTYLGIPYAKAPVGPLRWRPPKRVESVEGVFEAFYFGKSSIQTEWPTEVASYYPQGEDCLYLNIWTDATQDLKNKPVMVFFHGGSYGWGGTSDPMYNAQNLVEDHRDVIFVTVAYRLGLLGFVDFSQVPGSEGYGDSPNLGLLDQIEALRWISRNITAFGGDPNNVTIMGESAGGGSVSLLPIIPEAKNLFHRVICESGNVALTFSKSECSYFTELLMKESGCKDMRELLLLSESELIKINKKLNYYNNFPQRDGKLIPLDPYEPYANGETKHIDMLIGTNKNETNYWVKEVGGIVRYALTTPIKFENDLMNLSPSDTYRVKEFMRHARKHYKRKVWCYTEFYNELMFRLPSIRQAEGHAENGGRVYMYYWTEPSTVPHQKACHAVELSYVFGNLQETLYTGTPGDPELSKRVQEMWVNFARIGDPSTPEYNWPLYEKKMRTTMILGKNSNIRFNPLPEQRELLMPLLKYWICPSYATLDLNVPYVHKVLTGLTIFASGALFLGHRLFFRNKKDR